MADNMQIVLNAFETLFNKRDYAAAERFWSPNYIQHSAHIPPGREGLFALIKGARADRANSTRDGSGGAKSFDVMGFSLGGMIAQQLAHDYPDMIRRMMTSRRSGVRSRMTQITSNGSNLSTTASGSAM